MEIANKSLVVGTSQEKYSLKSTKKPSEKEDSYGSCFPFDCEQDKPIWKA